MEQTKLLLITFGWGGRGTVHGGRTHGVPGRGLCTVGGGVGGLSMEFYDVCVCVCVCV